MNTKLNSPDLDIDDNPDSTEWQVRPMGGKNTLINQLIAQLRRENAALQQTARQLAADNTELKKVLVIALADNLGDAPVVINRRRMTETNGEFELAENYDGDMLIRVRRTR